MDESITAADANRWFSRLLRGVREGRSYIVTSHGEAVAKLVPVDRTVHDAAAARSALLKRLRQQNPSNIRWTRDELYDDAS
ncbi:MAG: type II toxin-antitoxin system prevent-host-death family antitoxin [Candidatus Eremiobacteraeota bacterium]|nr:type II toxin-antitoxin system prevent-host-death family antitoxin [Candidatus Eremiobacteraeota bacterium]MBC5803284.1 type II toxin-antitoxin system prevent-host-death family antitoxin [Candidatus Eremiobacteraeota bacterium]MBC5822188.1 type II toxin-antitoxin system prevent-host-death family antitoxin [Candidatus Eremiobacteraeota bacterium]